MYSIIEEELPSLNPLPALMYQNVLDLNVACRAKRTPMYWHVRKLKCPLKKTQPSCPCSRDLNWTSKGLNLNMVTAVISGTFLMKDLPDIVILQTLEHHN
jgi:hypothetical protein